MMRQPQSGAVLLVALIMLILVTLTGVTTASLIQDNTKVLQNFEARANVRSAALSALQEAIATADASTTPLATFQNTPFLAPCVGTKTLCLYANGAKTGTLSPDDGIAVTLGTVECISASIIRNEELDVFTSPTDASCYQPGIFSLCAEAIWEVEATAEDRVTGARTTVRRTSGSAVSSGVMTSGRSNVVCSPCTADPIGESAG